MRQPLTESDWEVFVFMNEQSVLLSYTSPSCSAFGSVRFKERFFFVVIIYQNMFDM